MATNLALLAPTGATTATTRLGMHAVDPLVASLQLPHLHVGLHQN